MTAPSLKKLLFAFLITLFSLFASVHAQTTIDVGFSPEGSAEKLIIKAIDTAKKDIRVAAYSFTSPQIIKSLINAKRRGVDIKIVVDEKGNKSKSSIAAMNLAVNAGIPLRTISAYKIHHDKYIVVDSRHIQTGSFNYSQAANKSNSENVILLWNNPAVANKYLQHWQSRWEKGQDWKSSY